MPRFWKMAMVAILVVSGGSSTIATEPSNIDWPQWRGLNRDNRSGQTGLLKDWGTNPPKLAWRVTGIGEGYASVSVVGDRIYTTGNQPDGQTVFAIDAKAREIVWKQSLTKVSPRHPVEGSRCTPSVDGENLYVVTSDGQIACLIAADGKVVWQKKFDKEWGGMMMSGWGFSESPLVDGDKVLCTPGGKEAMIVALDKKTGALLWKTGVPEQQGAGYASIVVSEGGGVRQYVTLTNKAVIGVRASDGKFLWSYEKMANKTANAPTPIPTGDYVFASTGYNGGAALLKLARNGDGIDVEEVWYKPGGEMQNQHGGMVLEKGFVYFGHGTNNGFPICVEMATGRIAWGGKTRGPGNGSAAITYADGNIIFRYQSGEVALVEATPDSYQLKGFFKPDVVERECWAHPVVARGKLFLRDQNTLLCYDITSN